jgi:hypothetical protein
MFVGRRRRLVRRSIRGLEFLARAAPEIRGIVCIG